ncbi:MAG: putative 2-aminoethylphosphonate ABC transporter permease subunit [Gammaproteobacteria bacterium]|nr:putative 2-aminoethylphosphonate ABC transporter permease subunit [Gammaproteobacteria bacterium]
MATASAIVTKYSRDDKFQGGILVLIALVVAIAVLLPLCTIFLKSVENRDGNFVGILNYVEYFQTPALVASIYNTIIIGVVTTVIVITLAFIYAYALTRSCMPYKNLFRSISLIPLLAPSLLPAIALIYMFGNQGYMKELMFGYEIRGPIGIVISLVFWIFPHVVILLSTALSTADGRLYEAAKVLRTKSIRTFFKITLPAAKYGVMSACFVAFLYAITDFGACKVIGGWYTVLSLDIYKQVVGQQNFQLGSVVSVILLLPVVVTFIAQRQVQRKQTAQITPGSVPYQPKPNRRFDLLMLLYCIVVSIILLAILGTAAFASFVKFWPYNLSLSLTNYQFNLMDGGSWQAYRNSVVMSLYTAFIGTAVIFCSAYFIEKTRRYRGLRSSLNFLSIVPLATPGMVLGLAYLFFFNDPLNPLNFIYKTMIILVLANIVHYYTVPHLTATTALKQLDVEFESVSASLKVPFYKTFWHVTLPICIPALSNIWIYLFVTAITTVSAVVFLYGHDTNIAAVAVVNMDDAGDVAPAAAMAMMIVYTAMGVRIVHWLLTHFIEKHTQKWRQQKLTSD